MRSNFDELNPQRSMAVENIIVNDSEYVSDTPPFTESEEEEKCFELLSAYIDGEVTPCERRQVQEWLDNDPKIHQLYIQMLRLHQAIEQIPVPASSSVPPSQLSDQIFERIDQQRKGRFFSLGMTVVGAIFLGMLTSLIVKGDSTIPQFAKDGLKLAHQKEEGLMIALNHPVIDIPITSLSSQKIAPSSK